MSVLNQFNQLQSHRPGTSWCVEWYWEHAGQPNRWARCHVGRRETTRAQPVKKSFLALGI